jgi:hypothetical protein
MSIPYTSDRWTCSPNQVSNSTAHCLQWRSDLEADINLQHLHGSTTKARDRHNESRNETTHLPHKQPAA